MSRIKVHIGTNHAFSTDHPPRMGAEVFCGKIAGSTHGVITAHNFFRYGYIHTTLPPWEYAIHLTRKGIRSVNVDRKKVAARSIKMYGYYEFWMENKDFKVCKKCLDSEEFGLLALATL